MLTVSEVNELQRLFTTLENSADDTGCDGDLTVVSKSALEAVAEAFGTWESLNPGQSWRERHSVGRGRAGNFARALASELFYNESASKATAPEGIPMSTETVGGEKDIRERLEGR